MFISVNPRARETTPVPQTLKGNEKQLELAGNSSYRCKFQRNFDQGKGNLVRVRGEFELSEFELSRLWLLISVLQCTDEKVEENCSVSVWILLKFSAIGIEL